MVFVLRENEGFKFKSIIQRQGTLLDELTKLIRELKIKNVQKFTFFVFYYIYFDEKCKRIKHFFIWLIENTHRKMKNIFNGNLSLLTPFPKGLTNRK